MNENFLEWKLNLHSKMNEEMYKFKLIFEW